MPTPTPSTTQQTAARGDSVARPTILFWVEQDAYGEYAQYAANLARAWEPDAQISVWLGHKTSPCDFGNIPTRTKLRFHYRATFSLARHLRAARPDILVLIGVRAAWHGVRIAKKAGVKKVLYIALSDLIYRDRTLLRVARNYLVLHTILRKVDRVVVPANGSRYQFLLREWIPESNFHLLPKMFDPDSVPPPQTPSPFPSRPQEPPPTCRVVYAGPFNARARLDWLLRAWAFVEEKDLGAHLTIVGTGPREAELHALHKRLALRHCDIIPPERPLVHYVAAADLVAMTNLYELHSRLPLMAMGCGKPFVAMEADGIRISAHDSGGGILTPLSDVPAISEALATLIQDPAQRAQLGASGRSHIARFEPDAFRHRARPLLQSLIAGGAAP
ncbi:MAG: glycosyltransferase [Kiritimatiellae bacterium]|nr:glycosyltransferase [Kiritimatiellia bacterium]MCO5067931.1 glycosyltransferase [Kiritimatiellia bacterium]